MEGIRFILSGVRLYVPGFPRESKGEMLYLLLKQALALLAGSILFTFIHHGIRLAVLRRGGRARPFLVWVLTPAVMLLLSPPILLLARTVARKILIRNQFFFLVSGILFWGFYAAFNAYTCWLVGREVSRGRSGDPRRLSLPQIILMLCVSFGFLMAGTYSLFIEPFRLEVVHKAIPLVQFPRGDAPLRVVVIADLQTAFFGPVERKVPKLVEDLRPDLILLAGDYATMGLDCSEQIESARYVFSRIRAPGGIFAVSSDSESLEVRKRILAGLPITYLENEHRKLRVGGREIYIVGLLNERPRPDEAFREIPEDSFRILLLHNPDRIQLIGKHRVDLAVAGHTHGGQIKLPLLGPLITFCSLDREYVSGLSEYKGTPLYVSRGIGMEGGFAPRVRFLCRPELTLLELSEESREISAGR